MVLKFGKSAKELREAANSQDARALKRLYPQNADQILMALQVLKAARTLNDVMSFTMFRPHTLNGDDKDIFSMTVGGRKRLIVKTLDAEGRTTKKIDFSSKYGLIVEVSEHYGD